MAQRKVDPHQPVPLDVDPKGRLIEALLLLSDEFGGVTQGQLAEWFHLDLPQIKKQWSRLLAEGICRVSVDLEGFKRELDCTTEELERARDRARARHLEVQLAERAQGATVVISKRWQDSDATAQQLRLANVAARHLYSQLRALASKQNQLRIGVGYGYTVQLVLKRLSELLAEDEVQLPKDTIVFNMTGFIVSPLNTLEPSFADNVGRSLRSSSLDNAQMLAHSMKAHLEEYWGPGFIPLTTQDGTTPETLQKMLLELYDKAELYHGACHAKDADLLISGVGSRLSFQAVLRATHRNDPKIADALDDTSGDISGVVLSANGSSPKLEIIEQTSLGIGRKELTSVAKAGGVTVVASGNDKASAVAAALRSDLVSCVVMDEDLATSTLQALD